MAKNFYLVLRFRRPAIAAIGLLAAFAGCPGQAQEKDAPPTYQPGQLAQSSPDPIVAIVDGRQLHLSDLGDMMHELPAGERAMPFDVLYPALLSDLIDHAALQLKARQLGLDQDQAVARKMHAAAERALEQALLERIQQKDVTEGAIRKLYADIYGGKTAVEQVHLRLILVASAADAAKALARLKSGEEFTSLAREVSRDPSSVQGGDLGFLRREQLQPNVASAVFALAPGEVTSAPVRTTIGWCVIRLEQRESVAPPSLAEAHDELRRILTRQAISHAAAAARADASVKSFNLDGTPVSDQIDTTRADLPPNPPN